MKYTLIHSLVPVFALSVVLSVAIAATPGRAGADEIMGIALDMSKADARAHLQKLGTLERETRKRQEVWAVKDPRVSHLIVGYDPELRVRYVTALARSGAAPIRYDEVADPKSAERLDNQGNYKLIWEVAERSGHAGYLLIAHGHDPQYLDSYSIKKADQEDVD
jgi:hypothetical protein